MKEYLFVNVAFIVIDAKITAKLKLLGRFVFDNTNAKWSIYIFLGLK